MYTVSAAHSGKGTDATGKAAGQLLNLADLALVFAHLVHTDAKRRASVDLVNVLALGEDFQLALTCGAVGQPRIGARFDGCPVGHDQVLALGRYQCGPEHSLEDICNALSKLRNN